MKLAAERDVKAGDFPNALTRAQTCIELSLKGIYRIAGVDYPREHNVVARVTQVPDKVDSHVRSKGGQGINKQYLTKELGKAAISLELLTSIRNHVTYASGELGIDATDVFDGDHGGPLAELAVKWADQVLNLYNYVEAQYLP